MQQVHLLASEIAETKVSVQTSITQSSH